MGGRFNRPPFFCPSPPMQRTQSDARYARFFERLPAADFPILHPVKVVSLRDLHHAETLRFPLVAAKPAASALRPPL